MSQTLTSRLQVPVKIMGIEFTNNGSKLFSKWLDKLIDPNTTKVDDLYKYVCMSIQQDSNHKLNNIKTTGLFFICSEKKTSIHLQPSDHIKTIFEVYPALTNDHHMVVWVRH